MRYILMIALLGLGSSVAFADFQVYQNNDRGGKKFECWFRGMKKNLRCEVKAEVDKHVVLNNDEKAKLRIECNNGFEFNDHDAKFFEHDDVMKFMGRDDGVEAMLKIFEKDHDILNDDDDKMRATLTFENSMKFMLRGFCKKERDHD